MTSIEQPPVAPSGSSIDEDWTSQVNESRQHPLTQLVLARIREFYREPETIFWVYGFPLIMAMALGIAFRNQPQQEIVVAIEAGPQAQAVADALHAPDDSARVSTSTGHATPDTKAIPAVLVKAEILPADAARTRLRTGKVALILRPSLAARKTESTNPLEGIDVDYVFDPTRAESAQARAAVDDLLQRAAGRRDLVESSNQFVTEPGARYIDFLIPGLIGASLMGGGLWGVGFVAVDMRVRNLLKRFVTTPMKRSHFLGGLMISRFIFGVTEVLLLLVFSRVVFGVTNIGNWFTLLGLVFLGAWTFAGLGLLVASRARTLEAASGLMNLVMMPMYILSGIFFSAERFPDYVQPVIKALPLTALIDAMRSVMLEGATAIQIAGQVGLLFAWSTVCFLLALKLFRWT